MSTSIYIRDGVAVTRYVGPALSGGSDRRRIAIYANDTNIDNLSFPEALLIAQAIIQHVTESLHRMVIEVHDAGTD